MDILNENQDELFRDLFTHLSEVEQEPEFKTLDSELLHRVERSLNRSTSAEHLWQLLRIGERLLPILRQDPTPLATLLEKDVDRIPYDELKAVISPAKIEEGLASPSVAVQLLCL